MRRPRLSFALIFGTLALSAQAMPACSAAGDKTGATTKPGDGGITLDADICGYCVDRLYTPCDAPGKAGAAYECAIDQVCAPKLGCVACKPGEDTCVGNEVRACGDDGKPGALVKTCDAGKGERCSRGVCKSACDAVADSPSNVGCEFWAADLDNVKNAIDDAANKPWGLVLSNAGDGTAKVTIERNDALPGEPQKLAVVRTLTIAKDELKTLVLPPREVDGSEKGLNEGPGTFLSSKALRITSDVPLVVYQFNAFEPTFSNDASLLLPRNGLGKIHRVLGYVTSKPIKVPVFNIQDRAFVTVIGTTPGTKVRVTLGQAIVAGGSVPAKKKGEVVEATLGPFDVLNLESEGLPGDLTGTIVEADAPIAVFSGTEGSVAPTTKDVPTPPGWADGNTCCVDHLEEQVFPVTAMGKKYVVTRSPVRSNTGYREPDVLRFLGVAETATVTTTLPAPFDKFTLAPGELKETWTRDNVVVTSTAPVAVGQILVSQQYIDGPYKGDPSLTIFPSAEQYRQSYLFLVPPKWDSNYVVVSAPVGAVVKIDGAEPSGCAVEAAGKLDGVDYESRTCPVKDGVRRVTGDKPFGVTAYGYGFAGSYAFVGGADVKPIYTPPPLK